MESLVSGLQHLRSTPGLKKLIHLYYNSGKRTLLRKLSPISSIKSIYLKNGPDSENFDLGVSDLDFVIIVNSKENISDINGVFTKLSTLYPFIKDHDIFSEEEIIFLSEFGTTKFANHSSWELCRGANLELPSYYYHPYKFYIDQIDELYFLTIWLFQNLSAPKNKYRKRVIKRTLQKIFSAVEWIRDPQEFFRTTKKNLTSNELSLINSIYDETFLSLWLDYQREFKFIEIYNKVIKNSLSINEVIAFPAEFKDYSFSDRPSSNDCVQITNSLYESFYLSGCIDPTFLTRLSQNNTTHPYGALSEVRAQSLYISGLNPQYEYSDRFTILQKVLTDLQKVKTTYKKPIKFLNTNNLVSVSWGESKERETAVVLAKHFLKKQIGEFNHLHISLGKNKISFVGIDEVWIDLNPGQAWHKEALYNFAYYFCFGGKNFIFSDAEVYCEKNNWIDSTFLALNENDFIHGFKNVVDTADVEYNDFSWTYKHLKLNGGNSAQGLVWGMTSKLIQQLGGLPDYCPDGSNDSLLVETITGENMGLPSSAVWYYTDSFKKLNNIKYDYVDFEVIHINHGKQRLYSNRMEVMGIVGSYLKSLFVKNSLGVYQNISTTETILPIGKLFELSMENTLPQLNVLFKNNLINLSELLFLRFGENLDSNVRFINCLGACEDIDGETFIMLGEYLGENSRVIIHFKLKDLVHTEIRKIQFKFEKLIGDNQLLSSRVLVDWREEPYCQNLSSDNIFDFLLIGLNDKSELSIEFELNYLIPNQVIKLPKPIEDSISMVHSWQSENFIEQSLQSGRVIYFDLTSSLEDEQWYCVEIDCSNLENQSYNAGIYFNEDLKSMSQLRYFSNTLDKYQRVQFFKYQSLKIVKLGLHFEHENLGKSVKINILKRPILKPI